jgi:hypothetical protein
MIYHRGLRPAISGEVARRIYPIWFKMNSSLVQHAVGSESTSNLPAFAPPLWLWPNILSLDAPAIAVAWLALIAIATGARVEPATVAALGLTVWLIYVADRVLDGMKAEVLSTARHLFYRRYRVQMTVWFLLTAVVTAWLSLKYVNPAVIHGSTRLGAAVAIYFAAVHLAPPAIQRRWPKELVVALIFAAGAWLPVWCEAHLIATRFAVPFLLLAASLWINAVGIECWERTGEAEARVAMEPALTRFVATHLGPIAAAIAVTSTCLCLADPKPFAARSLYAAIAMSAIALAGLEASHRRITLPLLRVLADVALLTPLLLLPLGFGR